MGLAGAHRAADADAQRLADENAGPLKPSRSAEQPRGFVPDKNPFQPIPAWRGDAQNSTSAKPPRLCTPPTARNHERNSLLPPSGFHGAGHPALRMGRRRSAGVGQGQRLFAGAASAGRGGHQLLAAVWPMAALHQHHHLVSQPAPQIRQHHGGDCLSPAGSRPSRGQQKASSPSCRAAGSGWLAVSGRAASSWRSE